VGSAGGGGSGTPSESWKSRPIAIFAPIIDRKFVVMAAARICSVGIIARRDREIDDVPRTQVLPHEHQPIAVRVRQRPQQHGVYDAENGGAGANAERERDYCSDAERRHLTQRPRCVAEVVKQCPHIRPVSKSDSPHRPNRIASTESNKYPWRALRLSCGSQRCDSIFVR
jgi:hypothetical protein